MSQFVQDEISKVITKNEVFFAFSDKQFEEGKKEGVKYVNMKNMGFCPKPNVEGYINEMNEAVKSGVKKDVELNGAKKIISREYFNHECQITNDTSDMIDALDAFIEQFPKLFTKEVINKTAKECFNEAVEKDWF